MDQLGLTTETLDDLSSGQRALGASAEVSHMHVTKFEQSCLLIDNGDGRILIDPGSLSSNLGVDRFGRVDAILYTHSHGDHFDQALAEPLIDAGATVVANADVARKLGLDECLVIEAGQTINVAGFDVEAVDIPHMPMVDGSEPPPNLGFVLDGRFLHPGDGIEPVRRVAHAAVPIAGPGVSFRQAYLFVEGTGAASVVPIHYDFYSADPDLFRRRCTIAAVQVLQTGESGEF